MSDYVRGSQPYVCWYCEGGLSYLNLCSALCHFEVIVHIAPCGKIEAKFNLELGYRV